jgi:hypothetical protein
MPLQPVMRVMSTTAGCDRANFQSVKVAGSRDCVPVPTGPLDFQPAVETRRASAYPGSVPSFAGRDIPVDPLDFLNVSVILFDTWPEAPNSERRIGGASHCYSFFLSSSL